MGLDLKKLLEETPVYCVLEAWGYGLYKRYGPEICFGGNVFEVRDILDWQKQSMKPSRDVEDDQDVEDDYVDGRLKVGGIQCKLFPKKVLQCDESCLADVVAWLEATISAIKKQVLYDSLKVEGRGKVCYKGREWALEVNVKDRNGRDFLGRKGSLTLVTRDARSLGTCGRIMLKKSIESGGPGIDLQVNITAPWGDLCDILGTFDEGAKRMVHGVLASSLWKPLKISLSRTAKVRGTRIDSLSLRGCCSENWSRLLCNRNAREIRKTFLTVEIEDDQVLTLLHEYSKLSIELYSVSSGETLIFPEVKIERDSEAEKLLSLELRCSGISDDEAIAIFRDVKSLQGAIRRIGPYTFLKRL